MPSFDIISKTDMQLVDNAINIAKKEILNRFDFHGSKTTIDLDKKANSITIMTENDMRLDSIIDIISGRMIKQKIDPKSLDRSKAHYPSGSLIRKDLLVKKGIDKESAKKIQKDIKDAGLKVQAQIMDDQLRVTGKKIDDLQTVIALVSNKDYGLPLQYENMKS